MKQQNRPSGFTLIELLVVIAIIAVLVAMLLPALNNARSQAKKLQCLSVEKRFGTALYMYVNDYNGFIPPDYPWITLDWVASDWPGRLGPYLNLANPYQIHDRGFDCPEALRFLESLAPSYRVGYYGGYGVNVCLDGDRYNSLWDPKHAVKPPRLDNLVGDLVYMGDANLVTYWNAVSAIVVRDYSEDLGLHYPDYRHKGAATFVCIDGHAMAVSYDDRYQKINLWP